MLSVVKSQPTHRAGVGVAGRAGEPGDHDRVYGYGIRAFKTRTHYIYLIFPSNEGLSLKTEY